MAQQVKQTIGLNPFEFRAGLEQNMQAWNIKQLYATLQLNLKQCNNAFERSMVKAIGGREIRERVEQWSKERKLTPLEIAIAKEFGYKE